MDFLGLGPDRELTLDWQAGMDPAEVRAEALQAVAGAAGLSVTAIDDQAIFVLRRFLPTWAFVVGLAAAPFTGFLSLLLLLWRSDETLVVSVRPLGGGTHVRAHGAVHPGAADRLTERLGIQPTHMPGGAAR